jgi:hypothetical protein
VLLVNSGKADAYAQLRRVAPDAEIEVLTEASYASQYPTDARLHFVDNIGHLDDLRRAALRLYPLDAVVGPSERSLQAAGYLRSFLGLPGIGYETANLFTNKAAMKRALASSGLPVAEHAVLADTGGLVEAARRLGGDVVVKPALGTGSMNTAALAGDDAVGAFVASCEASRMLDGRGVPLLVERFVAMDAEYHCDGVVVGGKVESVLVSRYLDPLLGHIDDVSGSVTVPPDDAFGARVRQVHADAVAALGLHDGVTHLEVYRLGEDLVVLGHHVGDGAARRLDRVGGLRVRW